MPIADEEMELRAGKLLAELDITAESPNMLDVLEALKFHRFLRDYAVLLDQQMPGEEARYSADDRQILLSRSTADAARFEVPRARWTIAHEIGHLALGHATRSRTTLSQRSAYNANLNRDETDANRFAAAFLIPEAVANVSDTTTASAISERFKVSKEAAARRLEELQRMRRRRLGTQRPLPPGVVDLLARLSPNSRTQSGSTTLVQYEGYPCPNPLCGEFRLVRRGLFCVCEACGTSTGRD